MSSRTAEHAWRDRNLPRTRSAVATHRVAAIAVGMLLLQTLQIGTATAAPETIHGTYKVAGLPIPHPSVYGLGGECLEAEGIDQNTKRFVPPFDGYLDVSVSTQLGTWMVRVDEVVDPSEARKRRYGMDKHYLDDIALHKGEAVNIVACNGSGSPEATVHYWFSPDRLPVVTGVKRTVERHLTGVYDAPLLGTVVPVRYEAACWTGCVEFRTKPTDRYINMVEVGDDLGSNVSFIVYQRSNRLNSYEEDYLCTKNTKPIALMRDVDWIGVSPVAGPCTDGTTAMASSGTVELVVSSQRR